MTLIETLRQQYTDEYEVAAQLGWTVNEKDMEHNGPRFLKHWEVIVPSMRQPVTGTIHIWKIKDGWMCADIGMARYFKNHRKYKTAIEAMKSEHQKNMVVAEIIAEIQKEENPNETNNS